MFNYTLNTYEMKRDILNFSNKMSNNLTKPTKKFVMDSLYGIAKSKSCLISNIARALKEDVKLKYVIERLCDNYSNLSDDEISILKNNYYNEVKDLFHDEPIAIFDDSDIAKRYGKKFEDLDRVIDASSINKEVVNGYHICEAVVLGKEQKQPISLYSEIYSCKSNNFISKNKYTFESIDTVRKVLSRKCNMVFDRGYDDNEVYEVYVSHTRVTLPYNKKDYELVFVYGLSEERPLILLTNRNIKSKEDVIKVVRLYFYRWRVEEYFRTKKQEYDFENIRLRTLKSINNLNLMLTIFMGYLGIKVEKINKNLLTIKIIYASESLREKVCMWTGQIARGIGKILELAHTGIKEWQHIEERNKYKQLELKL